MTDLIDLTDVSVIDNHCHAVEADQAADMPRWRQFFTESPDPSMRSHDVAQTAFYRRLIHAMGEHFGVSGEESVLEARAASLSRTETSTPSRPAGQVRGSCTAMPMSSTVSQPRRRPRRRHLL